MVFKFGCTLVLEQSFYSMYGLTGRKRASCLPPEELGRRPESVGIAIPNTEVWVVDEQGRRRVGPGVVGESVVRGSHVMAGLLPAAVCSRPKRPCRTPISPGFFPSAGSGHSDPSPLPYVEDLLSPGQIRASGYFDPVAIFRLVSKCRQGARLGENDSRALAGILSLQLVHHLFVEDFPGCPVPDVGAVKMCVG